MLSANKKLLYSPLNIRICNFREACDFLKHSIKNVTGLFSFFSLHNIKKVEKQTSNHKSTAKLPRI
jgi:hypothetical protein